MNFINEVKKTLIKSGIFWSSSFILFILIFPGLVTGPAAPDIIISLLSIFGLIIFFKKKDQFKDINKILYFLIFFYAMINLISLSSYNISHSLSSTIVYLRFIFFSIFTYYLINHFKDILIKSFLLFLVITVLVIGFDSLKQFLTGENFFGMVSTNFNRPSGLFQEELIIGNFISRNSALMASVYFYLFYKKNFKFFNLYLMLKIISINLFVLISGERSALALIIMFDFFLIVGFPINRKNKIYLFTTILILFSLTILLSETVKNRIIIETYNQILSQNGIYLFSEQHQSHFESAIKMFIDSPLLGQGVNTFRLLCSADNFYINSLACSTHPHNFYIQLLAETGIVGVTFLLFFYLYCFMSFISLYFNKKSDRNNLYYAKYFIFLAFLINFFPLLPSHNFFNNWINIVLYLPMGFLFYFNKNFNLN